MLFWAAYLACSWTWCLGMFFPVLLGRDYGWASFAMFAAPNVIGAAAMGWVLSRPGSSEAFVARHRIACEAFSAVTRAFQVFFVLWLLFSHHGQRPVAGALLGLLIAGGVAFSGPWSKQGGLVRMALLLWLGSAAALGWLGIALLQDFVSLPVEPAPGPMRGSLAMWAVLPVCLFGFLLCPYLDLTFHRARQSLTPTGGRAAFTLGFGVLFASMIGFTLLYGQWMQHGDGRPRLDTLPGAFPWVVGAHILFQAWFTFRVHGEELEASPGLFAILRRKFWKGVVVLGAIAGIVASLVDASGWRLGESVYRCFMSCYGLLFPAYLWLMHIRVPEGATLRWLLKRFALSVGIAAPLFGVGYLGGHELLLVPGLLVVLLAGWVKPRNRRVGVRVIS